MVAARQKKTGASIKGTLPYSPIVSKAHDLGARLPAGARRSGDILAGNPLRAAHREYAVASALALTPHSGGGLRPGPG
jgi:hypothetical protein